MAEKKIAVKYCGGCNPRYDRAALVSRLAGDFPELIPTSSREPGCTLALVVNGCSCRCAAHDDIQAVKDKIVVCAQEDYDELRQAVSRLVSTEKGDR